MPSGRSVRWMPLSRRHRLRLVVHGVERGDEVVARRLGLRVEVGEVDDEEVDAIGDAAAHRLGAGPLDRLAREVHAGEAAGREQLGQAHAAPCRGRSPGRACRCRPGAGRPARARAAGRAARARRARDWPLSSAITSWKRGNFSYGTPPPSRKQSTMSSSTMPRIGMYWANTARLSAPAGARQARGVLGRQPVTRGPSGSTSSTPDGRHARRATRGRSARSASCGRASSCDVSGAWSRMASSRPSAVADRDHQAQGARR